MAPPLPGALGAATAEAATGATTAATPTDQDPLLTGDIAVAAAAAGLGEIDPAAIKFVVDYLAAEE